MNKNVLYLFAFLATFCFSDVYSQSKIKRAKENLSGSSESSNFYVTESSGGGSYSQPSFFEDVFGPILFTITLGVVYYTVIESPFEMNKGMHNATLNPYPFYNKNKGDYQYSGSEFVLWRADLSNYFFSEKGKVNTNIFDAKFRFADRFAVSGSYAHLNEKLINEPNQKLDIFFLTADYYRIRTPHVNLFWGLGAGYVGNEVSRWGFAINTGTQLFIRPFSIESNLRFGFFRFDDVMLFSVGPKFHFRNYDIGVKYQNHNIGGSSFSGISFGLGASF